MTKFQELVVRHLKKEISIGSDDIMFYGTTRIFTSHDLIDELNTIFGKQHRGFWRWPIKSYLNENHPKFDFNKFWELKKPSYKWSNTAMWDNGLVVGGSGTASFTGFSGSIATSVCGSSLTTVSTATSGYLSTPTTIGTSDFTITTTGGAHWIPITL